MNKAGSDRITKFAIVGVVLGVAAVVVASATLGANEQSGGSTPSATTPKVAKPGRATVMLIDQDPLRIRGSSFKAGERVRVSVDDGSGVERTMVTAGPGGGFVVSFAGDQVCSLTVTAVGDKGSRTSFQLSSFTC